MSESNIINKSQANYDDISNFNNYLNIERLKNGTCENCPMFNKGIFVGVDSADSLVSPHTVLFLGLNPGVEEARLGRPFVGASGRFLREEIARAGITSWAMANSLLCSSNNETSIIKAEQTRACCKANIAFIYKIFRPKIIVPCGNGAWSIFKVNMPITIAADHIFVSRGPSGKSNLTVVIPILHPSALIRSGGEKSTKFPHFFERLKNIALLEINIEKLGIEKTLEKMGDDIIMCFSS